MGRKVLVVAAHPDDEILGCGGTVIRHVNEGDCVWSLIMAEGLTSRDAVRNQEARKGEVEDLQGCSMQAARERGVEHVRLCGFPDNRMDGVDLLDVAKEIEREIELFRPDVVYTHQRGDVNVDHRITHEAVVIACRSMPVCCVKRILFFETPSSTEWQMQREAQVFLPNWFVNIEDVMEKKLAALRCYASEMRAYPHPRSYEGVKILAAYRGITAGCRFAEAFSLGRELR